MYTCRECEQMINQASEICPYCGADLTAGPADETAAPKKKRSLLKILLLWGLALGFLWLMVWVALPLRILNPTAQAEARAMESLGNIRLALASYAVAEGGFPPSLEELGDRVRPAAQWAQGAGYRLQYTPGPASPDGRVHAYSLVARPGNYGFRNFYTDDTGVVRATREDRAATAQDPPI